VRASPESPSFDRREFHGDEQRRGKLPRLSEPQPDSKAIRQNQAARESAGRREDSRDAERILNEIESSRSIPDFEGAIQEFTKEIQLNRNVQVSTLLQLLIALLARLNLPKQLGRSELAALEDSSADSAKASSHGKPYPANGPLNLPQQQTGESPGDQAKRWVLVSHELESGTTEAAYRKKQEQIIEQSDESLGKTVTGARRETLQRKRSEAKQNLATLDDIKAERLETCTDLNRKDESLQILRNIRVSSKERMFASARYVVTDHLDIAIGGISKNLPFDDRADFSDGRGGVFRVTNADDALSIDHWSRGGHSPVQGADEALIYVGPNGERRQYWSRESVAFTRSQDGLFRVQLESETLRRLRHEADQEADRRHMSKSAEKQRLANEHTRLFTDGVRARTDADRAIRDDYKEKERL
jgi:hypothetical protein